MDAAKSVTATFTLNAYAITATASPVEGGTVTCAPNPVSHGSAAQCTATANANFVFTGWEGACSGSTSPCTTTVAEGALTVTGLFRETVAPETTITSSPASVTNSTSASFGFTSSEANSTFECSLDAGAFAACTSPQGYTGLASGSHTFQVRAIDLAGNVDASPASYTWTIDLVAPETTITSSPASVTNSTSASFGFTSSEANSTFECSLDAGAFATCASPQSYTGLAAGSHTFQVRAIDPAGNVDASPASHTWTVDTVLPTVTITSKPVITAANQASYSVGGACSEDGRTVSVQIGSIAASGTCGSPTTGQYTTTAVDVSALAQGEVSLSATHTDAAGNSASATDTTTKDTVGPTLTIGTLDAMNNANKGAYGFTGTCETGGGSVAASVGSVTGSASCTSGAYTVSGLDVTAVPDGTVAVSVTQADALGNSTTTNGSVAKDTANPTVTIDTPAAITAANRTGYGVSGTCSEAGRTVSVTVGVGQVGAALGSGTCAGGAYSVTGLNVSGLADGAVSIGASVTDAAGNSATATASASKDTTLALTVTLAGTGTGSVSSEPAGISCGSTCSANFGVTTTVTLAATPDASSTFSGWSGACTGTGPCQVTMDAAKSVTATFNLNTYAITAVASPVEGGTVTCTPNPVIHGSTAQCTATANANFVFTGWEGACSVSTSPCTTTTATGALTVTANFSGDTQPPVVTINSPAPITSANQSSYSVSGACSENGRTVSVSVGQISGSNLCSAGAYSVTGLNVSTLPDGVVLITASQTDAAGNTGSATANVQKSTANVTVANQTLTGTQTIVARGVLVVGPGVVLAAGANVTLVAGEDVVIVQPLSIAAGARFEIVIDPSLGP